MIDPEKINDVLGQPLLAEQGRRVGEVVDVLRDDVNTWPTWLVVRVDDADRTVPVPTSDARLDEHGVTVPYPAKTIGAAPSLAREGRLHDDEQTAAYQHYGLAQPQEHDPAQVEPDPHIGPHVDRWIT
jgi:hypothetical protein